MNARAGFCDAVLGVKLTRRTVKKLVLASFWMRISTRRSVACPPMAPVSSAMTLKVMLVGRPRVGLPYTSC